jgi:F0F1-type ATP synthase assembly protein I
MSGHGHIDPSNRKVALLIAILAAVLAFSETLGKGAQTSALSLNIEASNLWSFFQAKTIRMTAVRTAAEALEAELPLATTPQARVTAEKRIEEWKKTAARYDSEPETQEGRKELAARAKAAEKKRDVTLAAYHQYEVASAALQLAIVLASATVITNVGFLMWAAAGLGVVGLVFCIIGFVAPTAIHLF